MHLPSSGSAPHQEPRRRKLSLRMARLNWFIREKQRELSAPERAVWLTIWSWDYRNDGAELSNNALAQAAGVNRTTAGRAVGSLVRKGLLKQLRKGRIGDPKPSVFRTVRPEEGDQ